MAEKQIGIRLDAKTNYLLELARRATGDRFDSLTDYVKSALDLSFDGIRIENDQEGYDSQTVKGRTLAQLADTLYQGTEAQRFLALARVAPWLLSEGESKLLRILRHSDYFAPSHNSGLRVLHEGRIQQHWPILAAIRDGEAELDILPEAQRPSDAMSFGLLGETERVALYKANPAKFKAQSEAYNKVMKGGK